MRKQVTAPRASLKYLADISEINQNVDIVFDFAECPQKTDDAQAHIVHSATGLISS